MLMLLCAGVCPVLCSGHGSYGGGSCHCQAGWKGTECELPVTECWDAACSGHGDCGAAGLCSCHPGWTGRDCEQSEFIKWISPNQINKPNQINQTK